MSMSVVLRQRCHWCGRNRKWGGTCRTRGAQSDCAEPHCRDDSCYGDYFVQIHGALPAPFAGTHPSEPGLHLAPLRTEIKGGSHCLLYGQINGVDTEWPDHPFADAIPKHLTPHPETSSRTRKTQQNFLVIALNDFPESLVGRTLSGR